MGTVSQRWPWYLRWFMPYVGPRKLIKCPCGRVMWLDAPQSLKAMHEGHSNSGNPLRECTHTSLWVFIKVKLGLLDRLTWGERIDRRLMSKSGGC